MSKKIELLRIKPAERIAYPHLKSISELQKMRLMPGRNVKPRALVIRRMYGNYFLYDISKTIPYQITKKKKERKRVEQRRRDKARTCKKCGIKFDYWSIKNDFIPFIHKDRLCASCYFESFRKYKKGIVYDVETTGTSPYADEILSLCIMDLQGKVLFEELFKPVRITEWPEAEEINGISPESVQDKKPFSAYRDEIQDIFNAANILITYNGHNFDDILLGEAGIIFPPAVRFDVMTKFAWLLHCWDRKHKDWKWFSLVKCASHYGYEFTGHVAREDAKATLFCYKKMINGADEE